jgi:uncharacterized protein YdcH (DUF465 family)
MSDAQLSHGDDVIAALLRKDDLFRQLVSQHHELDERIRELSSTLPLTSQQQFDEIALKKKKLALKDRIAAFVQHHQADAAAGRTH